MKLNIYMEKHRRNQDFALDKNIEKETFDENKHSKEANGNQAKKPQTLFILNLWCILKISMLCFYIAYMTYIVKEKEI